MAHPKRPLSNSPLARLLQYCCGLPLQYGFCNSLLETWTRWTFSFSAPLVTLLSALLSTTQCRHYPRGSELNITHLNQDPDPDHAYHCYAGHGYFADIRFLATHVPEARFVLNTRRVDNWVASMHRRDHLSAPLLYARVNEMMFLSDVLNHYFRNSDHFIAMRVEDFESLSQGDFLFNRFHRDNPCASDEAQGACGETRVFDRKAYPWFSRRDTLARRR